MKTIRPTISRRELLAGACALPLFGQASAVEPIELAAGPLTLVFEPEIAFVRYVRAADREILRGTLCRGPQLCLGYRAGAGRKHSSETKRRRLPA